VQLWDLETGKQIGSFADGFNEFLQDGKGFTTWDQERVTFCGIETGKQYAATDVSVALFGTDWGGLGVPVPIPQSHLLAVPSGNDRKPDPFNQWFLRLLGIKNLARQELKSQLVFLDTRTGHKVAANEVPVIDGAISPDGKTLALPMLKNQESTIEIWDIPPRKPLRWVLALMAIPSVFTLFTIWRYWKARSRSVLRIT
jgi:hypothetical protein